MAKMSRIHVRSLFGEKSENWISLSPLNKTSYLLLGKEMLAQLRQGKVHLPPLTIHLLDDRLNVGEDNRIDAYIETKWKRKSARFAVECKALSTPQRQSDGQPLGDQPAGVDHIEPATANQSPDRQGQGRHVSRHLQASRP
jgi:hypothetical protein